EPDVVNVDQLQRVGPLRGGGGGDGGAGGGGGWGGHGSTSWGLCELSDPADEPAHMACPVAVRPSCGRAGSGLSSSLHSVGSKSREGLGRGGRGSGAPM